MIPFPDKKYQIIYADPPWEVKKILHKIRPNQQEQREGVMICQRCGIGTTGNSICDDCKRVFFKSESTKACESIDRLGVILRDVVEELKKMNELTEGK